MRALLFVAIQTLRVLAGPRASAPLDALELHANVLTLASKDNPGHHSVSERGHATARLLRTMPVSQPRKLLLLSIGHHESRWTTNAVDPGEHAFGPTQIENAFMWGSSPNELVTDPVAGYLVANDILDAAIAACPGSWERALTVYVSGKCGVALAIARELCRPVGLCDLEAR